MVVGLATSHCAVVAIRTTRAYRDVGMELGRRPAGVALVAGCATGRGVDVVGTLAGTFDTIVAAGAVGRCVESAVISLGAAPACIGLVTTFATRRGGQVADRLASRRCTVMAARTTRRHGHIGMELGRCPAGVTLVAGGTAGCRRDVIASLAGSVDPVVAA